MHKKLTHEQLLPLKCLFMLLSLRMLSTGAEQIGMADMKGSPQLTVIQTTSTESLHQTDPAPGPVSTLTGRHPGQLSSFSALHHHVRHVFYVKPALLLF